MTADATAQVLVPAPQPFALNAAQQAVVEKVKAYLAGSGVTPSGPSAQDVFGGADSVPSAVSPFILAGLAGTGKTTLVKTLLEYLTNDCGISPARIALLAPTGKASAVLNAKQRIVTARTIHSFLYGRPNDKIDILSRKCDKLEADLTAAQAEGLTDRQAEIKPLLEEARTALKDACRSANTLSFTMKGVDDLLDEVDVIFVDEASMVGTQIAQDLLSIGLPVVFIGDGNQLPPVQDTFGVNLAAPTAKLTEIVRQASDSGVLALSREVLRDGVLPKGRKFNDVEFSPHMNPLRFLPPNAETPLGLPQFICYFNNRRHEVNRVLRKHLFSDKLDARWPHHPFIGERLVIDANVPADRLTRGDIVTVVGYGTLKEPDDPREPIDRAKFRHAWLEQELTLPLVVEDRLGVQIEIMAFMNDLAVSWAHEAAFDPANRDPAKMRYMRSLAANRIPVMFPYAITCHKSQGSEYPHVVLFNDKPKSGYRAYLYTGITRSQKLLTIAGA